MHDDEVEIDERLVRRLLADQFPQWAELPLEQVESMGTVNAIFRLGSDLSVRLPRTPRWHDLDREMCWLGALAGRLPILIPHVVARGDPGGRAAGC
jgi:aminoglycoside phosphotransferase (APT) family kinase protein